MRKYALLILFVIFTALFSPFLQAEEIGSPDQVHVYPQGANLTWVLQAREEMTLLLPSSLRADQFQYQAKEDAVVKSMEIVSQGAGSYLPPGLLWGREELEEIKKKMERIRAELAGIQQTIQYLSSFTLEGEMQDPLQFIAASQNLRIEAEEKRQILINELEKGERRKKEIEEELRRLYAGDLSRAIRLSLETNGLGYVEVTFFTPHASWRPSYKASLEPERESMALETYVEVRQQTGISWNGPISCHTAAPQDVISAPVVNPLVARVVEESRASSYLGSPVMESKMMAPMEDAVMDMEVMEREAGLTFLGSGYVPTDGEGTLLAVSRETYSVNLLSTLVPYQEEEAWLIAETTEPMRALLKGGVDLIVDSLFTGKGTLHHRGGGEALTMAFGRSPLITAERTMSIYQERRTWRGRNVLQDGYQIRVMNGAKREMEIVVIDRAPIAGDSRISIDLTIEPKPLEEENGILIWQFSLVGGESKMLSVEYEIEYPDGMDLYLR